MADESTALALNFLRPQTQPMQGTLYKPSPWNAITGGLQTYINTAIARDLYQQAEARRQREEALSRLGIIARIPGGLRTPAARAASQESGLNLDFGNLPMTEDEIKSLVMQNALTTNPELANYPAETWPELIKSRLRMAEGQYWMGQGGGPQAQEDLTIPRPGVGGTQGPPRATQTRTTSKFGYGAGGPTFERSTQEVESPGAADELKRYELQQYATEVERGYDSSKDAADAQRWGVPTSYYHAAQINDRIRQRFTIPAEAPSMKHIIDNYRRNQEVGRNEQRHQEAMARLDLMRQQLTESIRNNDMDTALGLRRDALSGARAQQQVVLAERSAAVRSMQGEMRTNEQIMADPNIQMYDSELARLNTFINDIINTPMQLSPAPAPGKPRQAPPTPKRAPATMTLEGIPPGWYKPKGAK